MAQRRSNSARAGLDDLTRKQAELANSCASIFEALDPLLRKERVHKPTFEHMIFSRAASGVVVHLPVKFRDKVTKKDLYKVPHPVGILANTIAISDPLSETALDPGAYLVRVRALGTGDWAFDFVQADNRKVLSTPASLVDPPSFASIPPQQRIAIFRAFDITMEPPPAGPDDLLPHNGGGFGGPDDLLPHPGYKMCLSLGFWFRCFFIPIGV